jgi:hypothetical protein
MSFPACVVHTKDSKAIGALFMKTSRFVVLLSGYSSEADLGPLRAVRTKHVEPEARVHVIPMHLVESIRYLVPTSSITADD